MTPREFGQLTEKVAQITTLLEEIRREQKDMRKSWDEARGGWRVLIGFSAVLGSGMTYGIQWLISHLNFAGH